jgi:hypothetical protein
MRTYQRADVLDPLPMDCEWPSLRSFTGRVDMDMDLYASCVTALDFIEPFLQVGTVMLFDDWNAFCASRQKGERAAVAQWLKKNPRWQLNDYASYGWHGHAFIVDSSSLEAASPAAG